MLMWTALNVEIGVNYTLHDSPTIPLYTLTFTTNRFHL